MNDKTYNTLFLCTGNSARSIMAEALLNSLGKERFHAFSAGSHPLGKVNPFAIELLITLNHPVENLRSKNWQEFTKVNAPKMDFIITVCSSAAGETCPIWPGHPVTAHWDFIDPAQVSGSEEETRAAFKKIFQQIEKCIHLLMYVPIESLDHVKIQKALRKIGKMNEII